MIQHRVIRHHQHAVVILHRRIPIQNALVQEHRQTRRRRQARQNGACPLEPVAVLRRIQVQQEGRHRLRVALRVRGLEGRAARGCGGGGADGGWWRGGLRGADLGGWGEDLGWEDAGGYDGG